MIGEEHDDRWLCRRGEDAVDRMEDLLIEVRELSSVARLELFGVLVTLHGRIAEVAISDGDRQRGTGIAKDGWLVRRRDVGEHERGWSGALRGDRREHIQIVMDSVTLLR